MDAEDTERKQRCPSLAGNCNNLIGHSKPRVRIGSALLKEWSCGPIRDNAYDFRLGIILFTSRVPFFLQLSLFHLPTHTLLVLILQPAVDIL